MPFLLDAAWWADLFKIILLDLILAGDNAVVIAMAVRGLPSRQRKMAILWGTAGAVAFSWTPDAGGRMAAEDSLLAAGGGRIAVVDRRETDEG